METKPTKVLYNRVREGLCVSSDINLVFNDNITGKTNDGKSFVGFIQIYTDKISTTLKINSLVAYPIHFTLLNVSDKFRRYFIDHAHTLVCFLPVGFQKMNSKDNEDCEISWK